MFTGIVETVARVINIENGQHVCRLRLQSEKITPTTVDLGASIAVNGVCLTVCEFAGKDLMFDVSAETRSCTTLGQLKIASRVNLEQAVMPSTRLGGHLVSGHVDDVGKVVAIVAVGGSQNFTIELAPKLAKYIAIKGSVTIDGVSLTVNHVEGYQFKLTLIPHTLQETTLGSYTPGQLVNIEVDVIARYIERLMVAPTSSSAITTHFLNKHGFIR